MRAPNGNVIQRGTVNADFFDFTFLGGQGYGINYFNPGGNDRVTGTVYDDNFILSGGAERIDGRGGDDTVNYGASTSGVDVDLNQAVQRGGFAEGDTLISIENVTGSRYSDYLFGNAARNVLDGGGGDDKIRGGDGDDTLLGNDGNDSVAGEDGNDVMRGGNGHDLLAGGDGDDDVFGDEGNDILTGGAGADWLDGGAGTDTVDYSSSSGGVRVNLETTYGWTADAQGDRYVGIENVRGSGYDDYIWGDAGNNVIWAGGGNDIVFADEGNNTIDGGAGDDDLSGGSQRDIMLGGSGNDILRGNGGGDVLKGGDGDDRFVAGTGGDEIDGGNGIDTLSYLGSPGPAAPVSIDMTTGTAVIDGVGVDKFTGIENLAGTNFNDTLLGDSGDNLIEAFHGQDVLDGGDGNDVLDGGAADDVLTGGYGSDTFVFRTPSGWGTSGGSEKDVITDFTVGADRLEFRGTVDSLEDLAFSQSGADTVITYGPDGAQAIVLVGVDMNQLLSQGEFIFS